MAKIDTAKVEALVAELNADKIVREAELAKAKAEAEAYVAQIVAEGGCAECLVYYCECY